MDVAAHPGEVLAVISARDNRHQLEVMESFIADSAEMSVVQASQRDS